MWLNIGLFCKVAKIKRKEIDAMIIEGSFPFETKDNKVRLDIDLSSIPTHYCQEDVKRYVEERKKDIVLTFAKQRRINRCKVWS